jgi:hypothetical protein
VAVAASRHLPKNPLSPLEDRLMSDSDRPRQRQTILRWSLLVATVSLPLCAALFVLFVANPRALGWLDLRSAQQPQRADVLVPPLDEDEAALVPRLLETSREIDLNAEPGAGARLWQAGIDHADLASRVPDHPKASISEPVADLLAARDDLRGLPLLAGEECVTGSEDASVMRDVARTVRSLHGSFRQHDADALVRWLVTLRQKVALSSEAWRHVRPLEQTLQTEETSVRLALVGTLAEIDGTEARAALARRAVFDPSREVRDAAVEALRGRPISGAREVFLSALRHPWPPAASHAALALVALQDEAAVPHLRQLLDQPDPTAPYLDVDGKWRKKEVVRVNHLRNCLLCHPPSLARGDELPRVRSAELRGEVPTPGQPLPPPDQLYGRTDRRGDSVRQVVRANVTYFRQDFSLMHPVKDPDKWPEIQRFDYFVRAREVEPTTAEVLFGRAGGCRNYPQREAVRWVLARLTGDPKSKR